MGEVDAPLCQAVDVGRMERRVPESQVVVAEVVDEDDDEVGAVRGLCIGGGGSGRQHRAEGCDRCGLHGLCVLLLQK